ncbi:MAG: hypothetical protein ABIU63_12820 [Chitinophagaceae bacterium]
MNRMIGLFAVCIGMCCGAMSQDSTGKELVGKYKFPAGSVIEEATVTWENGEIKMSSSAGVSVLERMKGDTFRVVSFSGTAVFKRSDAKKISGVYVDASGYVLEGVKEAEMTNATGLRATKKTTTGGIDDTIEMTIEELPVTVGYPK